MEKKLTSTLVFSTLLYSLLTVSCQANKKEELAAAPTPELKKNSANEILRSYMKRFPADIEALMQEDITSKHFDVAKKLLSE